jgi:ABC-type transport system involved in multi-copper enzyme maturation permease subunit
MRIRWSNSVQAWQERLGIGVLAGGIFAGWYLADQAAPALQVFFWLTLLLITSVLLRRGWFTLAGPMFYHDLVRTTRRNRFSLYRLYGYFTVILLTLFFVFWYVRWSDSRYQGGGGLSTKDNIQFSSTFFYTFTILQLVLVTVLAPAYTAGAVAEEKERRTLEYLLATDLRNHEIVLSKLGTRLANLWLMILTGLPILSLVQFAGGVDPDLILIGFVTTALTAAGLASLGIVASVYARKPRNAIVFSYVVVAAYLLVSGATIPLMGTGVAGLSLTIGARVITGADVLTAFQAGSPILFLRDIMGAAISGARFADLVMHRLRDFAAFQIIVCLVFSLWAIVRLRPVFLLQANGPRLKTRREQSLYWRLPVGRRPMMWKEFFVEGGLRFGVVGRICLLIVVMGTFWPILDDVWTFLTTGSWPTGLSPFARFTPPISEKFYDYARHMGAFVACVLLLVVAVRASTTISSERERQTLDGLLVTMLETREILLPKWLGSIFTIRWGWVWLGSIWALGAAAGGLSWWAFLGMLLAWFVYAGTLATLGLWFSLISKSGNRATILALFSTVGIGVGFLLVPVESLLRSPSVSSAQIDVWIDRISMAREAVSPPTVFGWLMAIPSPTLNESLRAPWRWGFFASALIGLACWAGFAVVLWLLLVRRFRRDYCRKAVAVPAPVLPPGQPLAVVLRT